MGAGVAFAFRTNGAMEKLSPPNRIRELRKLRRMTLERLADLTGLSVSYLSRLESGDRTLNANHMPKIARALGVKPSELIDSATASIEVDIVGIIADDHEVVPVSDHYASVTRKHSTTIPAALVGSNLALVVGNVLFPRYGDGDVITYVWQDHGFSELLGKECVVTLTNGRTYVKTLAPGSQPHHFHLSSFNAPTSYDVEVTRAARIDWVNRA